MGSWFPTFRNLAKKLANTRLPLPALRVRPATVSQRQALLRLMAVATEENLALAPLLERWSFDERRTQRLRIRRLAEILGTGVPLATAVEQVPGVLRDDDLLAIRFDAQLGTKTTAIRKSIAELDSDSTYRPSQMRRLAAYFAIVSLLGVLMTLFMQVEIAPELLKISNEFSMNIPEIVQVSNGLFHFVANFWWIGTILLLVVLWSMFSATPGRIIRATILGRLFSPFRESLHAGILEKLSIANAAGRPLPGALSTLARYHFDPTIRHRLLFVRNEVEQGSDIWHSMNSVGILTLPEARLLVTAERVGNRTWVLEKLADVKRCRTAQRRDRLAEILLPAFVVTMGAFVLLQALTVFVPLTNIIGSLL